MKLLPLVFALLAAAGDSAAAPVVAYGPMTDALGDVATSTTASNATGPFTVAAVARNKTPAKTLYKQTLAQFGALTD